MGSFICGCSEEDVANYTWSIIPSAIPGQNTLTNKKSDLDGYQICPKHGERLAGWRPSRTKMGTNKKLNIDFERSLPDTRDMRDPEELGKEILSSR